jgi:SET domain-containing protein
MNTPAGLSNLRERPCRHRFKILATNSGSGFDQNSRKAEVHQREPNAAHKHVFTRLKPSPIHGVGVFAIIRIKKGTRLFQDENDEITWIDEKEVRHLPKGLKKLYDDFAVVKDGKYGCLSNFNRLTMGWYLNDSNDPNVAVDNEYNMFALRDIEEGEELTIDSSKFSEQPYRSDVESVAK